MRWRRGLSRLPLHAFLIGIAILWLVPSLGLLVSSFRPRQDLLHSGWWTVIYHPSEAHFTIDNYRRVLLEEGVGRAFLNSFTITVPATFLCLAVAALAAYALAWTEFRGRRLLLAVIVGLIVVPLQLSLVPLLRLYRMFHLRGTFLGVWLAHTGFGLPFMIYLLRNFFAALPRELFESAFIDGASHLTAFTRLLLPLSVPVLASAAIFEFLWVWNDLLVALVFLGGYEQVMPLPLKLALLVGSRGEDWHLFTSAAFISMLVPMGIFLSLQRYFVRGILAGAVKG
jgi:alpha-glucoside transport system permease protein